MTLPAPSDRRQGVTPKMRETFLAALREGHSISSAARRTGRNRRRYYDLRENDEDFAAAMQEALDEGVDRLEDELVRAAVDGWEEIDVHEERGAIVRRVSRHRRAPQLLAKVREWRRPAIQLQANVEYQALPPPTARAAVGMRDIIALAIETGQAHLLGLERFGIDTRDIVDAELEELPAIEEGAPDA